MPPLGVTMPLDPGPTVPEGPSDGVQRRFLASVEALLRDGTVEAGVDPRATAAEDGSVLRARARQARHRAATLHHRAVAIGRAGTAYRWAEADLTTAVVHRAVGLLMLTFGVDAGQATAGLARLAAHHRLPAPEVASRLLACCEADEEGTPPAAGPVDAEPAVLHRALAFIHRHAGKAIGVGEIADAAAVSPRELQRAFRRHRDTSPSAYLRRIRLEGAHLDLRAGDPRRGDTVASIAARWGFAHAGRFSQAYQERYEQPPSHTLRTAAAPARPSGP